MKIVTKTPQKSLDTSLLRFRPQEADFARFKTELDELTRKIDEAEREDNQEIHVLNFLRDGFYKGVSEINKKGTIDLAIHLTADKSSPVAVIIETKRPGNKAEMLTVSNPNTKALHELVLYFMRERMDAANDDIKYLVATNINEWFVFNASDFNRHFYENTKFRKSYEAWHDKLKISSNTPHFYNEIAKPFIDSLDETLECTHFDLREYSARADKKKLIALYKLLSPYHLLKTKFADDSNTLDKKFYTELLHIIGLEEYKEKSKTLIQRKLTDNTGSLMEMAMTMLDTKDVLPRVSNVGTYGDTREKRHEAIALELCITWINRILFLKLLEAQLLGYHDGDQAYRFLNLKTIPEFDELFTLFHQVLAKTPDERRPSIKDKYARVPYLNSSLFEPSDLENETITIESLKDQEQLKLINISILKKLGETAAALPTLEYLFRFLDAYDFASEGKEDVQKENRPLINASVLGKVFEKINGYKDGSIYTPGFITMYMCRQAIRLAVVQKFKDAYELDIATFDDLYVYISRFHSTEKILEFNALIDSLKICDPAVGSGHFLVSALNEILAIKSELEIFADDTGKPFGKYSIAIVNDELIVKANDENIPFAYKIRDGKPLNPDMQRLQSALFHEKQSLIENCLFGVDINPNSVKICRLRLWIELLKNAYYKPAASGPVSGQPGSVPGAIATGFFSPAAKNPVAIAPGSDSAELETLPNIDINIKEGNSLISRFALDADLADVLKQVNFSIDDYRSLVRGYKETRDRAAKRDFETQIRTIKEEFTSQLNHLSPERRALAANRAALIALEQKSFLFGEEIEKKKKRLEKISKLKIRVEKQAKIVKSLEENVIYKHAFEWRFEFPEVLDTNGAFLGFDIIIGNPPYISAIELKKSLSELAYQHLKAKYATAKGAVDLFVYFFERGLGLVKAKSPLSFITPNRYLSASYADALREYLSAETQIKEIIDYSHVKVFKEASTYPLVTLLIKNSEHAEIYDLSVGKYVEEQETIFIKHETSEKLTLLDSYIWGYLLNDKLPITEKVIDQSVSILKSARVNATSTASEADAYHNLIRESKGFKLINTGTIDRYESLWGRTQLTDKGNHYLRPYLPRNSDSISTNRNTLYGSEKIILAKIALSTEAFYDENGKYASINTNCLHSFNSNFHPKYILAWLNSQLFQYTFECFFEGLKMQGGYLSYSSPYLSKMYIKEIPFEIQTPFIELVDQILEIKKSGGDTAELESRIDEMVFDLYELTEDEKKLIRGST